MTSTVHFDDFRVYIDLRAYGFHDVIGGGLLREDDGRLTFSFGHSVIADYCEDDWAGTHTFITTSMDDGASWRMPERLAAPLVQDETRESYLLAPIFRTRAGTAFYVGYHQRLDAATGTQHQDMSLRDYTLLFARRARGQTALDLRVCPPGIYLGEQFMEGGLQLPSGRLVFTLWGIAERGQNWRAGVLISDDDGDTWRFVTVAYAPDLAIRDNPRQPAGFNEQTLFLTRDGVLVSIIRGREQLGRGVPGSQDDTWFFRAESRDDGETWSPYAPTNLPGTGATTGQGLTLPDSSLLIGCRVPYSRTFYSLPEPELFGLHFARSFDAGRTWTTERIIQRDPEGQPFNYYYTAMNGRFLPVSATEYDYLFGFFGYAFTPKLQRMLKIRVRISS